MSVKVTAMNIDYRIVFTQNNIRFAGQSFIVQFVTETLCMEKFSYQHLRLCILCPDAGHIVTSRCLIMYIGHVVKIKRRTIR
jgi:hypothetical protein